MESGESNGEAARGGAGGASEPKPGLKGGQAADGRSADGIEMKRKTPRT